MSERTAPPASRRALLRGAVSVLATGGAGGCGFRPLYGGAGTGDSEIAAELAATRVAVIPERFGQLLRRGLQQRLGRGGPPPAARWELLVGPNLALEGTGILLDGTVTRGRYIATANWTLIRVSPRETVASGFERAIDAFNLPPNQYFAADASRDAVEHRLAEVLAEEVVTRLTVRLRDLQTGAAPRLVPPVNQPAPAPQGGGVPGGLLGPGPGMGGGLEGGVGTPDLLR